MSEWAPENLGEIKNKEAALAMQKATQEIGVKSLDKLEELLHDMQLRAIREGKPVELTPEEIESLVGILKPDKEKIN